ncbi:MAG: NAD(P)-dependent alcohol dehydrogenase, partial [Leptolyngbya sp. SIO1D8]|nr:NAD(P)-dependent alcohol dehydrogenase [Leptolyngbya sp. SIO1D8]
CSFAVQIAKAFGADVTGVGSTQKLDMLRAIGADHVIDYTQVNVTPTGQQYDLIIDAAAYRSFWAYLPALRPEGTYVVVGGAMAPFFQAMLLGPWMAKFSHRHVQCLAMKPNQDDLTTVRDLLVAGTIAPFIDQTYQLSEVPAAIRYLEQRQVQGKIAVLI